MKAKDILGQSIFEMGSREDAYDAPGGERSMKKTVEMFNTLVGVSITTEQGWKFMEILKMVRSEQGEFKADNYVDGAAYASLAGEEAQRNYEKRLMDGGLCSRPDMVSAGPIGVSSVGVFQERHSD